MAGLYFSQRLKSREETLKEIIQLLREMSLLIRHRALTVEELFNELSRYTFIQSICDPEAIGDFRSCWLKSVNELSELQFEEREILKSVGLSLGTSDIEGQLSMLEVNIELLSTYVSDAHEQYNKKAKLYRTCGILGGLFLAIIVI